ncbi:MAG: thermonuclease family protein, partial [Alphaproteobacteria bacterium]|nr:thermonuclease family protein [Alphaproteobacteria bacterium]
MAVATVLAAALLAPHVQAADYSWPVVRVVDGDTVKVDASADLPPELASLSIRLRGVDTPEKGGRAKCETERQ